MNFSFDIFDLTISVVLYHTLLSGKKK